MAILKIFKKFEFYAAKDVMLIIERSAYIEEKTKYL